MKLSDILQSIKIFESHGKMDVEITSVEIDSRKVQKGSLFIAVKGVKQDGHIYIEKAIQEGAAAILCQELPETIQEGVTYVKVADTLEATGWAATRFFGDPSRSFDLVGVTGTNGKTTIATLLYKLMRRLGYKAGLISTVCNYVDGEAIPTDHTTPDAVTLNHLLGRMAQAGCRFVFMEVSSHAVDQRRISGLCYKGGIFTNLTRDHLDYHKTVENYLKAKKRFFDDLPKKAFALTNLDDKNGMVMVQNTKADIKTYSLRSISDFKGKLLESHLGSMLLDINGIETSLKFMGKFNASNLLAVFGAASLLLNKTKEEILMHLSALSPVRGRLETIQGGGITAVVDYAHTPDALANVLDTLKDIMAGKGTLITVFGAGGDRDKGKRPLMAKEAASRSDKIIVTSDNPRSEEPQDIINDILSGLSGDEMKRTLTIADRKEAIRTAVMIAQKGDAILVAGKGHEDYQEIKGVKHHFDDMEILRELLETLE